MHSHWMPQRIHASYGFIGLIFAQSTNALMAETIGQVLPVSGSGIVPDAWTKNLARDIYFWTEAQCQTAMAVHHWACTVIGCRRASTQVTGSSCLIMARSSAIQQCCIQPILDCINRSGQAPPVSGSAAVYLSVLAVQQNALKLCPDVWTKTSFEEPTLMA